METYPEDFDGAYTADVLADQGYSRCVCGQPFHGDKVRGGEDYSPYDRMCWECGSVMEAW